MTMTVATAAATSAVLVADDPTLPARLRPDVTTRARSHRSRSAAQEKCGTTKEAKK